MEDRIGIIDVLAVGGTEIVQLQPRNGVVEVDSYFTERGRGVFTVGADVLSLVHTVVNVDNVLVPVTIDGPSTHEHLGDEPVEVGDPVRLCQKAIAAVSVGREPLMNDARLMVGRYSGKEVAARNRLGHDQFLRQGQRLLRDPGTLGDDGCG